MRNDKTQASSASRLGRCRSCSSVETATIFKEGDADSEQIGDEQQLWGGDAPRLVELPEDEGAIASELTASASEDLPRSEMAVSGACEDNS